MGPPPSLIVQSLTQKSANNLWDLERLEFLGDSFLKIAVTRSIYDKYGEQTSGQLTRTRTSLIRNSNLLKLKDLSTSDGKKILRLPSLMNVENVLEKARNRAVLAPLWSYLSNVKNQPLEELVSYGKSWHDKPFPWFHKIEAEKRIADCVESLIGAFVVTGGEKMAARFMLLLDKMYKQYKQSELTENEQSTQTDGDEKYIESVLLSPDANGWPDENESIADEFDGQFNYLREVTNQELTQIAEVETELGYTFKSPKIARFVIII